MNEALDELVSDYVYYVLATKPPALSFTEWCDNPVLCDQELLAASKDRGGSLDPSSSTEARVPTSREQAR